MCVLQQIVVYGSLYSVVCILHCRTGVDKFVISQAPPLISKVPVLSYYDTTTVQLLVKHVEMEIITSTVTYLILRRLCAMKQGQLKYLSCTASLLTTSPVRLCEHTKLVINLINSYAVYQSCSKGC